MNQLFQILAAIALYAAAVPSIRGAEPEFPPKVSLDEIRHQIDAANHAHPRLLVTREQLTGLVHTLDSDPLRKQIADTVVAQANSLLDAPPIERKLQGRRLLGESRRCVSRVLTLSTAYYLTGDSRYVDRCKKEMLTAARFSDWNPSHFLDVGEMTFALAVGYDWLHDQLDDASRKEIRTAIVEKGLKLPFETKYNAWVHARNNWGQVCHGGLTAGALAVMDDEPDLTARTVKNALDNVVISMAAFAPHGSFPEGPGYWTYGTSYNVLLIASLESALGSGFGLASAPGFSETGGYPALVFGPSGQYFNYADGHSGRSPGPILFWFASRFNRPDWLIHERELWRNQLTRKEPPPIEQTNRLMPLALLWLKDFTEPTSIQLPLSWTGDGKVPIAVHRSSWTDPRATFLGIKAGSPSASHGHMDIGSFVLDSDGVRWATDLGSESYYEIESRKMDLWNFRQNSDRWLIFRLSNLSHNTLVIDNQLQRVAGNCKITAFSGDPHHAFSIIDMTPAYQDQAQSAQRGFQLLPTGEVLIQDELTGLHPGSHVRWGMVTTGVPDDLGNNKVTLHQKGEQLTLKILAPANVTWTQIDTAKPRRPWDTPNLGTQMISFDARAPESGRLTLAVLATPGSCQKPSGDKQKIDPLENWSRKH